MRIHHGDRFSDPYEWLRDKENPEVIGYLEAENDYTEAQTRRNTDLADAVFGEIKARTKETDLTRPQLRGPPGRRRVLVLLADRGGLGVRHLLPGPGSRPPHPARAGGADRG